MGKGQVYHDPKFTYADTYSNRNIQRLTDYLGHSNHFYFTDPCWFNNNRSFVFTSQRENSGNLFRYDLDDGKITQITDLNTKSRPGGIVSATNNAAYFWHGRQLIELNLETLAERIIHEQEGNMAPRGRANPTADGKYICTHFQEEIPEDGPSISFAYSRFVEYFEKKPYSQIVRIEIETGKLNVIHEDNRYLGHINTSPSQANILTYCHEGPWARINQRIWASTSKPAKPGKSAIKKAKTSASVTNTGLPTANTSATTAAPAKAVATTSSASSNTTTPTTAKSTSHFTPPTSTASTKP